MLETGGVFAVERGGGFALGRVAGPEAELLTLAVDLPFRRKGLASALLDDLHARAAEQGAEEIFLEVAETNAPAQGLYAGQGYREVGRRPGYYCPPGGEPVDALILYRSLAHPI